MSDKKVITGTGRCGTTFLIQLLTNLGYKTGYTKNQANEEFKRIDKLRGGIEHSIGDGRIEKAHYIKNPEFSQIDKFKDLLERYTIEHVYIPIRHGIAVSQSRELMHETIHGNYGGYWLGASNAREQTILHSILIYDFIHFLALNAIPFTIISFELMMEDSRYLHRRLDLDCEYEAFEKAYKELLNPDYVRF